MSTKIEWTDETWNPLIGCTKCSPGCDGCYAIGVVHRGMSEQHVGLTKRVDGRTEWTGEVREVPHMLDRPLRWQKPKRVFVNSLSDLFHPDVSDEYIAKVFDAMALAPQHTFQVLTKRPQRMAALLNTAWFQIRLEDMAWPLPNVWLGVSIENDRYTFRVDHLRNTPAAVRWISAEPLLGPLPSLNLQGIDWLVAGGESGPGARPMHPDWVRDLRDRCLDHICDRCGASHSLPLGMSCADHDARRTAFLFKQWGNHRSQFGVSEAIPTGGVWMNVDGEVVPDGDQRLGTGSWKWFARMSKASAGRTLDSRTWDEYPATNGAPPIGDVPVSASTGGAT